MNHLLTRFLIVIGLLCGSAIALMDDGSRYVLPLASAAMLAMLTRLSRFDGSHGMD